MTILRSQHRAVGLLATVLVSAGWALTVPQAHASSVGGDVSRAEALYRAQDWVTRAVPYSQSAYATDVSGRSYRTDCSGFISMAWHLSSSLTTQSLPNVSIRLASLDAAQPADMFDSPSYGHAVLFVGWTSSTHLTAQVMEEPSSGLTARLSTKSRSFLTANGFSAYRYDNLVDDVGHDLDAGASNDVLGVVSGNDAWRLHFASNGAWTGRTNIGGGWTYDLLAAVGDIDRSGSSEVLGVVNGNGWMIHFTSGGVMASRVDLGGGWTYDSLTGIGDVNSDGSPDVLGVVNGHAWVLHFAANSAMSGRTDLGVGWTYDLLSGVGDINRDGSPDVLGEVGGHGWLLHLSSGSSWSREDLGVGWTYDTVTGLGDLDRDGLLEALGVVNGHAYTLHFATNGSFGRSRTDLGTGWAGYTTLTS